MEREAEALQLETWARMLEKAHRVIEMTDAERCVVEGLRRHAARLREERSA